MTGASGRLHHFDGQGNGDHGRPLAHLKAGRAVQPRESKGERASWPVRGGARPRASTRPICPPPAATPRHGLPPPRAPTAGPHRQTRLGARGGREGSAPVRRRAQRRNRRAPGSRERAAIRLGGLPPLECPDPLIIGSHHWYAPCKNHPHVALLHSPPHPPRSLGKRGPPPESSRRRGTRVRGLRTSP